MKKVKKFLSVLCAACMAITLLPSAMAADLPSEPNVYRLISAQEFNSIAPRSTATGRVMLPRSNSSGTNGVACSEFVADESNVSFTIDSAPGCTNYNVQLYLGTIKDGGSQVYLFESVNIGAGASFSGLEIGKTYFFKVSSSTAPSSGSNASWTRKTYPYLPMLRLILKTSVRLPTFHFHIT